MLDKVGNMRIQIWNSQKAAEQKADVNRRLTGEIACPSMLYHRGVTDLRKATGEDLKWCELECPYMEKCDPVPKREYILANA